jgi:tetratricopeptide (TPR) repeat protein
MKKGHALSLLFILLFNVLWAKSQSNSIQDIPSSLKGQDKIDKLNSDCRALAQTHPEQAFSLARQIIQNSDTSHSNMALGYKDMGIIHYYQSEYNEALSYYDSALLNYQKILDWVGIASILNNKALIFMEQGMYNKALDMQFEAYEINHQYGNEVDYCKNLTNIANIYMALGNHTKAMEYNQKAFTAIEKGGNNQLKADVLNNLGTSSAQMGQHQNALQYYSQSLAIRQIINDQSGVATCYANIGNACLRAGDYKNAEVYYQKAMIIFDTINNIRGLVSAQNFCSQAYLYQTKYKQGKELLEKALSLAEQYNLKELKPEILKGYKLFLLLNREIRLASKVDVECRNLEDSLSNESLLMHMADLEATFQANEKERQLQQLKLEREAQIKHWSWLVACLAIIILLGIMFITFIRMRQRQKTMMLINQKTEIENRLLRSQMNPHFIFNSLNAVQSYIMQNRSNDADIYLSKFARLMRLVLEHSAESFVSLEREMESLVLYLELEQNRFSNRFVFKIEADDQIEPALMKVPPMLIQPYVENALIHGLMPLENGGKLEINYQLTNSGLKVTIYDNGIGRREAEIRKSKNQQDHKSMGLGITRQRLDMLNKTKENTYFVAMHDLMDENGVAMGTKVEINMPWIASI